MEDRVLRFEKAKSNCNIDPELEGNESPVQEEFNTYYPQVYVPYYSYGVTSQQIHTFQVPQQPMMIYPPPHINQIYPSPSSVAVAAAAPSVPHSNPGTPSPVSIYSTSSESFSSFDEMNKIFVGHLNGELVTQRKLLRYFQRYGHITDIELFKNNLDGTLRHDAFAFISFLKPEQMLQAIKGENGQEWLGRQLKCCKALKKRDLVNSSRNFFNDESENIQICLNSSP